LRFRAIFGFYKKKSLKVDHNIFRVGPKRQFYMSMDIYYFSGTGNSLAVARDIAAKTGGRLLSIASVMDNESINSDADALGMIFPVYHKSIPLIIKRFVEKLENLEQKYMFAVYTFGDSPGLAARHLGQLVQARSGQLATGWGVHLPYNYLTPSLTLRNFLGSFTLREIPVEKQQALFAAAPQRIAEIAAYVNARQSGAYEITSDVLTRLAERLNLPETLAKTIWLKVAGVQAPDEMPFLESRQLMDRGFWTDEGCNGCAVCARLCPVGNIELVSERPVWQQRCEQCFACLHWCPKQAIQFGSKTAGKQRYHHPDVKLADMLRATR
jgi:ferredoxin